MDQGVAMFSSPKRGSVILRPSRGQKGGVRMDFSLFGFRPNSTHAIHIHQWGDTREGCKSLGPHYNPTHQEHGNHHGDLFFNFTTDAHGRFSRRFTDPRLSLSDLFGRSFVVHKNIDDKGIYSLDQQSLLNGNAGPRIAYAIIARSTAPVPPPRRSNPFETIKKTMTRNSS